MRRTLLFAGAGGVAALACAGAFTTIAARRRHRRACGSFRIRGPFIHDPGVTPNDGLAGPVIGKGQANPNAVRGGAYAPYVVERWTTIQRSHLYIYFVVSTWNPYVVELMTTRFSVR